MGRGFIFPKHKEAIDKIGGEIVEKIDDADWVVILTPNYMHYEQIIGAENMGKKVICEKPLVTDSKQCESLIGKGEIYTILQLRHLPILKEIKKEEYQKITIKVLVHRDKEWFESWKGKDEKSGGILFNLAIHYIDLVIHLFGEPTEINPIIAGPRECIGSFKRNNYNCGILFSSKADKDKQQRILKINDKEYNVETSENLHIKVYEDIMAGKGIGPEEALKSIKVAEKLQIKI